MIVVGGGKTKIAVRSLWLLLVYASDMLTQLQANEREAILAGNRDADLLDAIAEILVAEVERRLRSQLTFHYRRAEADLTRVRGRVDHLRTTTRRLMDEGRVACTFDELSIDSPRNRFIAITLTTAARQVQSRKLSHRCAAASFTMQRLGVNPRTPTRAQLSADRLGRRDASDRRMLDAAHLVHDMALPTHQAGQQLVPTLIEDDHKYRILFEKAVRGYFRHTMGPAGWTVGSTHLTWPHTDGDSGADRLPRLETDTVLRHTATGRQIVIETKFTDALYESRSGTTKIDRNYLFQLYAYLMSQTGAGNPSADTAEGALLFVAANGREPINDTVHMQGHRIRFLSVDLTETPDLIRRRWQLVVGSG